MIQKNTVRLMSLALVMVFTTTLSGQEKLKRSINERKEHSEKKSTAWRDYNSSKRVVNKREKQGYLGVEQKKLIKTEKGVAITVDANTSASKAGLKDGDIILEMSKVAINSFLGLANFMRTTKPNDKVEIKYLRDGITKMAKVKLGESEFSYKTVSYTEEKEACLGVYSGNTGDDKGSIISGLMANGAAQEVAMQKGDIVTKINGKSIKSYDELWDEIAKYKPKQTVTVHFIRNEKEMRVNATLKACKPKEENIIVIPPVKNEIKSNINLSEQRQLKVSNFNASPNPIVDLVQIEFKAEALPTTVSLFDINGRVLFQQTLNDFNGTYNQRFDLSNNAKGVVLVQILQDSKVFTKRLVVN